ncbi:polysaccharide biosynthesis tyrosine autokinase [Hydrogenophaga sp. MI9]|uniref:GumC family protein n=1 Tax=Hydrogenophaga sp. MI9 TaxID=3453719 RepID=UPI003EEF8850
MSQHEQLPSIPQPPGALTVRPAGALQTHVLMRSEAAAAEEGDEIDLRQLWRMLVKHSKMIAGTAALCGVAALLYTLRATPVYQAEVVLQIDPAAQRVVGFKSESDLATDNANYSDPEVQLRTQIELLNSRSLAERVVDEVGLYRAKTPEQLGAAADPAPADSLRAGDGARDEDPGLLQRMRQNFAMWSTPSVKDEKALDRSDTVSTLQGSLTVTPLRNTRLVSVQVNNKDPELAARIANQMAKSFIAVNLERKLESSVYARSFLEDQIRQVKAKLEEAERKVNEYAKNNSLLNLGDKGTASSQSFVDFSAALSKAEQDRIKAESLYNQVKLAPETAPQVQDNDAIKAYKEQKARLEAEYAKNLATFKPDFPGMVQARAQLNELDARIDAEIKTVLASIKVQYEAARKQEEALKSRVATSRSELQSVQDRSVDMNLLQRELDTNRQVYDSLLQRLKEVSVTGGLTTNNVSVVDEATVPLFPFRPRPMVNIGLGLMLGLFLGVALALLREQMDDSIKHADEIESQFGVPLLGLIPLTKPEKGLDDAVAMLAHLEPRSAFAEAYRSMRTALQFSTADGAPKRFMVTSCGKAEGKSTTALALAINFAQLGQRVLLIDADMRKPSIHKSLRMPNERGLSNLLTGDMKGNEMLIHPTVVPSLSVLTAGPTPPDPVELLMGPKFGMLLEKAQELGFTQVVIDGPPLLGIADAIVLGNQIQHIVFAVKAAGTKRASVKDALRRLRNAGIAPMGVVLTHARSEHSSDYSYEAYYGYGNEPAAAAAALPASTQRREPSLGKAEGPGAGVAASASGPAPRRPGPLNRPLLLGGGAAATVLLAALAWVLWPSATPEKTIAKNHAEGVVKDVAPPATAPAAAAPAAIEAPVAAPAVPSPAPVAAAAPAAAPAADDAVSAQAPELASLKDSPTDTWPALADLWGAKFNPNGACDNAIAAGLQCFRLPAASVADLRVLDRPGLVQLKQGGTQRWVMLRALDAKGATLVSGPHTWRLPVAEFEKQWSGGYSTLWRLPPGFRERLFTAKANDAAGQWLDTQLKALQKQQKLEATANSFEARVKQFQTQYRVPGDGKAQPPMFLLVNRMVSLDEPHLASGG